MGYNYQGRRPMLKGFDKNYVSTPATSVTLQPTGGAYYLSSTVSLKTWNLRAPRANEIGQTVELAAIKCTTSLLVKINFVSCSLFSTVSSTSVTRDTIRMSKADQCVGLRAWSTSKYRIIYSNNSPLVTTS